MKKSRLKLVLWFLLLTSGLAHSQNFYELKWSPKGYSTQYKAFLIYNNDQEISVRVRYSDEEVGSCVAQYNCKRKEYEINGQKRVVYDGYGGKVIQQGEKNCGLYYADNFVFEGVSGLHFKTLYVTDDQSTPHLSEEVEYTRITKKQLTKEYLLEFYSEDEEFYQELIGGNTTPPFLKHSVSKLTLIAIGATTDPDTNFVTSINTDINRLNKTLKNIAKKLNVPYEINLYTENKFNKETVINNINSMEIDENEVVFMLYRGHGFRWVDQPSDFPRMKFGNNQHESSYNFESLHKKIKDKNPRLIISIGDLCNTVEGFSPSTIESMSDPIANKGENASYQLSIKHLLELLEKQKGEMLIVSARPGEKSYASIRGGYYSECFLNTFLYAVSTLNFKTPTWGEILNKAAKCAKELSIENPKTIQNAMTKVDLKQLK